MKVLKCWAAGIAMCAALSSGVNAETTVSQSNDPSAAIIGGITSLLGREKTELNKVSVSRLKSLVTPVKRGARKDAADISYDRKWLSEQPVAQGGEQFQCLATALYFEARGEGIKGQAAVAEVILNRVDSKKFPQTVCGVVNQSNGRGCQFSFTCDGRPERVADRTAWSVAGKIARAMLDGAPRSLTDGATYFHTPAVRPSWSRRFQKTATIGRHIFYRPGVKTAMN